MGRVGCLGRLTDASFSDRAVAQGEHRAKPNYAVIRQAIRDKHQVTAIYDGLRRELCPHVIGTTNGREHVLFYQFGGRSRSGLKPDGSPDNWRCVFVDELSNVVARPGNWHSAPEHTRRNNCVEDVDVVVRS